MSVEIPVTFKVPVVILFELISPVLTPTFSNPEPSPKNLVALTIPLEAYIVMAVPTCTSPRTSNSDVGVATGFVVPIPTRPADVIRNLSTDSLVTMKSAIVPSSTTSAFVSPSCILSMPVKFEPSP